MPCLPPAFSTHPLYPLRLPLLLSAPPAFFFAILSITSGYNFDAGSFIWHLILATVSALINIYELVRWGLAKLHDPDAELMYPLRRILVADVLLAVFFGFIFAAEIGMAQYRRYGYSGGIVESYASMTALIAAVLHAVCAWKQLMALKRKDWEKEQERYDGLENGEGCGHYQRTMCPSCGAKGVLHMDREVPYAQHTPTSSQTIWGLDLATGYEIIPDKVPGVAANGKGKKSKEVVRPNSQTSLMEE